MVVVVVVVVNHPRPPRGVRYVLCETGAKFAGAAHGRRLEGKKVVSVRRVRSRHNWPTRAAPSSETGQCP